jgi:amino acid transporter
MISHGAPLNIGADSDDQPNVRMETSGGNQVRHLRMLPLAVIVFYNVSGGPFGIEESVRSAGFAFSILGFIIMPLVWSIPESMVTAELGSAYPEASGGVAWVEEAFGSAAGWMAGFLGWVSGATDSKCQTAIFRYNI